MIFHFSWPVFVRPLFLFVCILYKYTNSVLRTYHFVSGAKITCTTVCLQASQLNVSARWLLLCGVRSCISALLNSHSVYAVQCAYASVVWSGTFFYPFRITSMLKYFSASILSFLLAAIPLALLTLYTIKCIRVFGECPLGFLSFRRPSKQATLSANACNVSTSPFFSSLNHFFVKILCNILMRLVLVFQQKSFPRNKQTFPYFGFSMRNERFTFRIAYRWVEERKNYSKV